MTLGTFIYRNAVRSKRRTALTVLSVGFSLFLLMTLFTMSDILSHPPVTKGQDLRLAVRRSTSFMETLPMANLAKIEKIPHVKLAMPMTMYMGHYKDPKTFFASTAVDPVKLWEMFPEFEISEETKLAFATERTACVVGSDLLRVQGWRVGQKVTLTQGIQPVDLEFTIVGTYHWKINNRDFYLRHDYLQQALGNPGTANMFWIMADSAEALPAISEEIDAMFHNTAAETKTETEKAFMLNFVSMLGNVQKLLLSIAGVVVFTMLLVTGSTMAAAIRERMREVGILKSMGYPRGWVLTLILGEGAFIAFLGCMAASAGAVGLRFLDVASLTQGFIPAFDVTPATHGVALGAGIAIGLVAGIIPALRAANMTITQALRRAN